MAQVQVNAGQVNVADIATVIAGDPGATAALAATFLPLAGGTLTGNLDVGCNNLLNVSLLTGCGGLLTFPSSSLLFTAQDASLNFQGALSEINFLPLDGVVRGLRTIDNTPTIPIEIVALSLTSTAPIVVNTGPGQGIDFPNPGGLIDFSGGNGVVSGLNIPAGSDHAANKGYVDTGLATKVMKTGDTITGTLTGTVSAEIDFVSVVDKNKLCFQYSTFGALPSNSTYHGMFAHVHDTASAWFAHSAAWIELAQKSLSVQTSDIGTTVQAFDTELLALSLISINGFYARTGSGTVSARTIAGTALNISVTNGDGVAGDPVIDLVNAGTPVSNSFVKITTDTKGRVSGTSAVVAGDITPLVDATYVNVSGDTMTGELAMGGSKVTGLANATVSGDALHFGQIGTAVQAFDADLSGLAALASTGIVVHTAPGAFTERTISFGVGITGTNGSGVAGNPSVAVASFKGSLGFTFGAIATDNFGDSTNTLTVTGAVAGDIVTLGLPSTVPAGFAYQGFVSSANTVTVRAVNSGGTTGAADANATINVIVLPFASF